MPNLTVYSKPSCVQCDATKRHLDRKGVEYTPIDVTQDSEALAYVQSLGYLQVPVVVTETEHWSGYRPDLLNALVGRVNA